MEDQFTKLQGQYLAFIVAYAKPNRRAPAEADAPAEATVVIGKIAFAVPTEIGHAIFILAGRDQRLHGCFLQAVAERIRTHEETFCSPFP